MRTTIEPLDVEAHLARLHAWVTHPRSVYWGMLSATPADVSAEYTRIAEDPHHHAHLGRVDGEPAFLVETYDPARSEAAGLVGLIDLAPGDLGMHVLVAPPVQHRPGFTSVVFRTVMEHCFADPAVTRVVVEPDVGNHKIAALNAAAGFVVARHVALATKTAALSFCTRAQFADSRLALGTDTTTGVSA